jgi:hypothetical protein
VWVYRTDHAVDQVGRWLTENRAEAKQWIDAKDEAWHMSRTRRASGTGPTVKDIPERFWR